MGDVTPRAVLSTPECTCEASCSGANTPASSSCELHKSYSQYDHEQPERSEIIRDHELEKLTDTHEKRMKYFKKEMLEYLQETAWMYKPIEHYVRY